MGKYKEDNGTTRVGDLLRGLGDIGKPILEAASSLTGNEWLSSISNSITTSKELKEEQKQAALSLYIEDLKDVQSARDNETLRDSDENSSWLSKNIHEMIAIVITVSWIVTWFIEIDQDIRLQITSAVMLIYGYLYGRTKPQS